ncbi:hypothetical protein HMPREF9622_01776 [Cutibacterium modestum HL037PA3]|uniref:Uncharacterized protein n=1 Tax=Cutibacterium modestum HL044PA1 TaxID=765109 RepID=A0ABN0C6D3_9ACTN|nr:hypothetical protein HMPREF9621_01440 [Cutibacterium modestum HL037PA2]EFS92798.1 hypothetical protein HMPREF9607_01014 [Cutibacterium modestum HL044PA1]EFT15141.1 hypothetical protein HMPREF9622_01776 [Cutibacterium modestum HL037PA3]EGG26362.1 hypothetical protein PA08_2331 [Cutibacterium modestum P08]REB73821.1 hypothetical protein CP877_09840 [Cutibacterium modestum]
MTNDNVAVVGKLDVELDAVSRSSGVVAGGKGIFQESHIRTTMDPHGGHGPLTLIGSTASVLRGT